MSPDFILVHSHYSNRNGQAVDEGTASSGASSAVVVSRGAKMVDLNKLIDPHGGWFLEGAGGINDKGQIVGRGMLHGKRHAFLLTPLAR